MVQDPFSVGGTAYCATAHCSVDSPLACQMIEQAVLHHPLPAVEWRSGCLRFRLRGGSNQRRKQDPVDSHNQMMIDFPTPMSNPPSSIPCLRS